MEYAKKNDLKITIFAPNFHPMVGGLETVTADIARGLSKLGCIVTLITLTPCTDCQDDFPFEVYRKPKLRRSIEIVRGSDIFVMFNVSLKGMHLWLISGKPLVVSHHGLNPDTFIGRTKNFISNYISSKNIGCSTYISRYIRNAIPIPNPYNNQLFRKNIEWDRRPYDIVFLGRLVPDKGADYLIQVIANLKQNGIRIRASIIGDGPEKKKLVNLTDYLGVAEDINFLGIKKGEPLVELLNQHKIMVVPSLCKETFGLAALEGIACGCLVVGSDEGGLPEAIGGCGLTVPSGNLKKMSAGIIQLLENIQIRNKFFKSVNKHLEIHSLEIIAQKYLAVLEQVAKKKQR